MAVRQTAESHCGSLRDQMCDPAIFVCNLAYFCVRQDLENSFHVPDAVPALFIVDHWCPHSSMRARAATFRDRGSVSDCPEGLKAVGSEFRDAEAAGMIKTGWFGTKRI